MSEHGLAHGLTDYGDRDFSRYLRRSFAQSMGYSRALLEKPVIGIAYIKITGKDPSTYGLPMATFLGAAALVVLAAHGGLTGWYEQLLR